MPDICENMKRFFNRQISIPLALTILFSVTSYLFHLINLTEVQLSTVSQSIEKSFQEKEIQLHNEIIYLTGQIEQSDSAEQIEFIKTISPSAFQDKEIYIYIYRDSLLTFWSDQTIPIENDGEQLFSNTGNIVKLPSGYYYGRSERSGAYTIVGLFTIYQDFPYQNRFLENGFHQSLTPSKSCTLDTSFVSNQSVSNTSGDFVFSVVSDEESNQKRIAFPIIFIFYLLAIGSFLVFIRNLLVKLGTSGKIIIPFIILIALLIRYIQIRYRLPDFIYQEPLFSPLHFAWNTWFASLGDFITHVFLLLVMALMFWYRYRNTEYFFRHSLTRYAVITSISIVLFLLFRISVLFLETLIINSTLLLSFDDILKLNATDLSGFLILIMMFTAYVYISYSLLLTLRKNFRFKKEKIIVVVTIVIASCVAFLSSDTFRLPAIFFFIFLLFSLFIRKKLFLLQGTYGAFCMLLFALSFGYILNTVNNEKEISYRNLYAIQLSNEQDPIGEYLFEEIANKMQQDTLLRTILSPDSGTIPDVEEYFRRNYLNGYFSKYHFQTTICHPTDILFIVNTNVETPCREFFESLKMQFGTPTMVPNYWLIDDGTGRPSYLFDLSFQYAQGGYTDTIVMYLELISIPKITGLGYPELLVEEKVIRKSNRYDYSWAKYYNGGLIHQYGDYYYPLTIEDTLNGTNNTMFSMDGFSHLLYPVDEKTSILVSLSEKKPFENAATYSYLLFIFAICHYLIFILTGITSGQSLLHMFAFKTRLQTASIFLVILSFVVAGVITVNFFIRYHNNKNKEIIREKSFSLLVELEHKLSKYDYLDIQDKDYLSDLLTKFSNVFFTDINLFSPDGKLIATSRPQIYQLGLTSELINPLAKKKLEDNRTPFFLQNESIGKLNYTSSYLPFMNYRNEVIAYLNLPYFARENELKKEISTFLIAFINFYIVLILFAIIIALVISNYITMPLRIISEKLRMLKPGLANEKIQWQKQDEIGLLIKEYNRMVDELAASTQQLMRTERESAWREMAKQIAHEIKNPLTPMKLSLQNLQRAWNDKAPDYEQRMKRTSQTLIEQIDALSQIATEFSNFAKMQETKLYPVRIIPILNDIIHLYESENIHFQLEYKEHETYILLADDTQFIQIMNNIIKNAVQSCSDVETGQIVIDVSRSEKHIQIKISDNGCGIPDEIRHKIFSPSFTSKSGGTGLGLAITKKITDHLKGNISFDSEVNKGTTFYLKFPEHNED